MALSEERRASLACLVEGDPTTYYEWLKSRNWEVSSDEYVSHKHMLAALLPLLKVLERFLSEHGGSYNFPVSKFSAKDMQVLRAALQILKASEVPVALLKIKPVTPPIKLR